jgi:YidC/Oxa1 family membrane protein insertase
MDSGRFVLAVILMIAVVVITNVLFPPVGRKPATAARDTVTQVQPPTPPASVREQLAPPSQSQPAAQSTTPASPAAVVVESPLYRYGISTVGASLVSAEMLNWQSFTRKGPVQLAPRSVRGLISHRIQVGERQIDLATLPFTTNTRYVRVDSGGASRVVRFTHSSVAAGTIEVDYEFLPDEYIANVTVSVRGMQANPTRMFIDFGPQLAINEARAAEDERALAYVINSERDGIHNYPLRSVKAERIDEGPLNWVAIKNKYFVAAALVDTKQGAKPFGGVIAAPADSRYKANIGVSLPVQDNSTFSYRIYAGPQELDRLGKLGNNFQDVNPYGWRWARPVIRPIGHFITWSVLSLHRAIGLSYGWILVLFGVVIRLLMWPLQAKAMRSQLKNMELQPRIKDLQTRYKDKPEVMQREMLKLYKEEGFNPMGGCLPMLIPFPVLITLFFVFQSTIQFRGVPFLWLPDLSRPDPLYILPVLLGITMLVQQWLSMKTMPPNPQMKFMMWFMPLFMVMIFFNLASGLNLYYMAQNIPGFFQQMQLTRERERYQRERGLITSPAGKTKK